MNKKIFAIVITSIFLLFSFSTVSGFKLEKSDKIINQNFTMTLDDYSPEVNINNIVNFKISVLNSNGKPKLFCNYKVYTRPYEEDVSYKIDGDKIIGEFTPTREGMYSLIIEITGLNNQVEKTIYYYFVNPAGSGQVRYYFRDINPTHGQPGTYWGKDFDHDDVASLLLTPPSEEEHWQCVTWVQNSPDEVPEDLPFYSILENIDIYCWYRFFRPDYPDGWLHGIGVQRIARFNKNVIKFNIIPKESEYTWTNTKFYMSWSMVGHTSWYWLSLKLIGANGLHPFWMTKPEQPSYADFYYSYSDKPFIKSNSNLDISILSATTQAENSNYAEIILEGKGKTNLVIQMKDKSKIYSAKLNGVECDFTQANGLLTFDLQLDLEHSEHLLSISPKQIIPNTQQFSNIMSYHLLKRFPILERILPFIM